MSETRAFSSPARSGSSRVFPRWNRALRILQWLALLGGVVLFAGGAYDFYRSLELRKFGAHVNGRLHDATIKYTNRGRAVYRLTFDYTPEGSDTTYRKVFSVGESEYHELSQAREAPITFLLDDPEYSQIGAEAALTYESLAMGGAFLLIAVALAWFLRLQRGKVEAAVDYGNLPRTTPVES